MNRPDVTSKRKTSLNCKDVIIDNVTILYGTKKLLCEAELKLINGGKYSIIGPNGSGKSTLLHEIATRTIPIPDHTDILLVQQELAPSNVTIFEYVLQANTRRTKLLELLDEIKNDETGELEFSEHDIYKKLNEIRGFQAESDVKKILTGLGFSDDIVSHPVSSLSGGWQVRASLAKALFLQPDLLILDEPTNHLDLEAVFWLELYLQNYTRTILVASHDIAFMDGFTTNIICIRDTILHYYKGNYSNYRTIRDQEILNAIPKRERKQLSAKKKFPKNQNHPCRDSINLQFLIPSDPGYPLIQLQNISFSYSGNFDIIHNIDMPIGLDTRVSVVGPNGVGKSTLMKVIMNHLQPTLGSVYRNHKVRISMFDQHKPETLGECSESPIEFLQNQYPDLPTGKIRGYLSNVSIPSELHTSPMNSLSGGQKCRIALVEMWLAKPHILFLDEPTNHLDIEGIECLIKCIKNFDGGVFVISHDAEFIKQICDDVWYLPGDGSIKILEFSEYKRRVLNVM